MIQVKAIIGIGRWKVGKQTTLCACPHVGDMVQIDDVTVVCERVVIFPNFVQVEETVRFAAEADLDEYVQMGWIR